jgi:hypothetical protein
MNGMNNIENPEYLAKTLRLKGKDFEKCKFEGLSPSIPRQNQSTL